MTGSMKAILTDKIIKMEQYLTELEEIQPDNYSEYISSKKDKYAVERLLQLIVDLALDINNIIIKDADKPPASDYYNSFIELIEIGVLNEKFAYEIAPSTGLRNRLVHEYENVDDKIVFESIDKTYNYYIKYIKEISEYMKL